MIPNSYRNAFHNALTLLAICGTIVTNIGKTVARDAVDIRERTEVDKQTEKRLDDAVRYLASDELEGRGLSTKGIHVAADYLATQFRELGLKTDLYDGSPFQTFKVTISSKLGPKEQNRLEFVLADSAVDDDAKAKSQAGETNAPDNPKSFDKELVKSSVAPPRNLKLSADFTPLAVGGSGKFDLPLAFVGYGISSNDPAYDDYAKIDVKGKAVIMLRHTPQQGNPHGPFQAGQDPRHAPIVKKISNAYQHGAEAVLLVTDEVEIEKKVREQTTRWQKAIETFNKANDEFKAIAKPTVEEIETHRKKIDVLTEQIKAASHKIESELDPLLKFDQGGDPSDGRKMPVLHVRRGAIDALLQNSLNTSLSDLEQKIDADLKPQSRELAGWRIRGETNVERVEVEAKNVVAVLEGTGSTSDETIVIGAHYDHLGRGESGAFPTDGKEIRNGADDNASGTAVLIEVARELSKRPEKLPRRVVFIAFTGEERGLLGSAYYVRNPLFPIEKTVAMLNMDMVGRLKDEQLVIYGTGTAQEFDKMIDRLNEPHGFKVKREAGGFGPSDHQSFYSVKIPVLHFFTGLHNDYHRASDDSNKVNVPGMRRVGELVAQTAAAIAMADKRPAYAEPVGKMARLPGVKPGERPYFGSIPLMPGNDNGYEITGVSKGGPADLAGLKGGDVILKLGDNRIGNLDDFDSALRKFKAGDKVPLLVRREKEEVKLEVTLETPR